MKITNVGTSYIKATSDEIAALISDPSPYTKLEITATLNCGNILTQNLSSPFTDTATILLLDPDSIRFNPSFFGLTAIANGIYRVSIKFFSTDGTIFISNCGFVDIDLSCQVASLLHNIIGEYQDKSAESPASIAHILHYSLVNGNNCGCNCDEMCKNYAALLDILSTIDPQLIADCGCN